MPDPPRRRVAVALGSNLGDRHATLTAAVERLSRLLHNIRVSTFIETSPEGAGLETQPLYLNGAVVGETELASRQLLDALSVFKCRLGRLTAATGPQGVRRNGRAAPKPWWLCRNLWVPGSYARYADQNATGL